MKVEARRLDELLQEAVTWAAPKAGTANPVSDVTLAALLLGSFLQDRCRRDLDLLADLRSLFDDYARQLERADSEVERRVGIIAFAAALGSGRRQLRRDHQALMRGSEGDAVADRYRRRVGEIEQRLAFAAHRYGTVIAAAIQGVPFVSGEAERLWTTLEPEALLERLIRYEGDVRVSGAAFQALATAVDPFPADRREVVIGEYTLRLVYRTALDHRQDSWIQCRALEALQSLSPAGFAMVAERRLAHPFGRDGALARRRIVQLIGRSIDAAARTLLLTMACADPSPDVRLAVAEILPGLPRAIAAPVLARLARADRKPQVRAAALLSILGILEDDERREDAAVLLADVCRNEADGSVLLMACRVVAEGADRLDQLVPGSAQSWSARLVPYLKVAQARARVLGEAHAVDGQLEDGSADRPASGGSERKRRADVSAPWRQVIALLPNAVAAMRRRRNPNLIYSDLAAQRITAQEAARELRDHARRRRRLSQATSR
ncbi:MAG: HEAT repeat domain-containing protein [Dongiaceae bacterium]